MPQFNTLDEARAWRRANGMRELNDAELAAWAGLSATPQGYYATPNIVDQVMQMFGLTNVPTGGGISTGAGGLNVQPGLDETHWGATYDLSVKQYELSAEIQRGQLSLQQLEAQISQQELEAARLEREGNREDARLARELQAQLQREQMALEREIAGWTREYQQGELDLQTRAQEMTERQYGAELASDPANFVKYEEWKRRGGQPGGSEALYGGNLPAAAQQQGVPQAAQAIVGEFAPELATSTPAGTVISPLPKARKQAVSVPGGIASFDEGGVVTDSTHSDEELRNILSGFLGQDYTLYNPALGGTGIYGAQIPSPGQVSRRKYLGLDPTQLGILQSFLQAGIDMGGFSMMQKSWVPGLAGATTAPSYEF
jgi:hypothetical protein